jgi:hypothetical protein
MVRKVPGHKGQGLPQRYAHLDPENLREAVLRLDRADVTNQSQSEKERVSQNG